MQTFKELQIWQMGMELARAVYLCTRQFPKEELYGLTSQMRRAAVSIPSNIAEGHTRRTSAKDFSHFLRIALGSLAELETQLLLAQQLDYTGKKEQAMISENIDRITRMIRRMHQKVTA